MSVEEERDVLLFAVVIGAFPFPFGSWVGSLLVVRPSFWVGRDSGNLRSWVLGKRLL